MERGPLVLGYCSSSSCSTFQFNLHRRLLSPSSVTSSLCTTGYHPKILKPWVKRGIASQLPLSGAGAASNRNLRLPAALEETNITGLPSASGKDDVVYKFPRLDESGRFCCPRAARELALMIVYASCLEGADPVRLFEKRLNAPRELGYEFDKGSLLKYDHMRFGGPPITTTTIEEADQLLLRFEAESAIEEEVLAAPPKLVYSKLLLRFTKKLLGVVANRWDNHVVVIDKVAPTNWKIEPAGRILEFSILHLAMSEISGLGTRHQIVINEAVDLAKRFCDGGSPRIINGCLRTFVQDLS